MNGGSLNCEDKSGPLFFVTNSNANILLNSTELHEASGVLLQSVATKRWGHEGSNGGQANITASKQILQGELIADKISSINLKLQNGSSLKGCINTKNESQNVSVQIDNSSNWTLTKNSYVNKIAANISGTDVLNIIGNGYTIYYSKADCPNLKGKSYQLKNGGQLKAL